MDFQSVPLATLQMFMFFMFVFVKIQQNVKAEKKTRRIKRKFEYVDKKETKNV